MNKDSEENVVSVIIPTYNRQDILLKAVENVLKQTHKQVQLVIVDDSKVSCLDELNKAIKGHKGCTLNYVFNGRPVGANRARNQGIDESTGNYIAFLDDDDDWHIDKLKKQMQVMKEHPDCPLVTCGALDYRYNRTYNEYPPVVATQKNVLNAFSYSSTSTYLFRSYALKQHRFDENLTSGQEYELAINVSKHHKIRSVPELLVTQNASEGQISTNWKRKRKGIKDIYKKHKKEFLEANKLNGFKVFGIVSMFYLAQWIGGKRVFGVLQIFKKRHASGKTRILFIYKQDRSFIHQDYALLSKHYDVTKFRYTGLSCIPKMRKKLKQHDGTFIWFASLHAYISTFFSKKPMVIVTGGYDVAGEKKINYGLMIKPFIKNTVVTTLKKARAILAVSKFNQQEVLHYTGLDSELIYNCVDSKKFKPKGVKDKNMVITVGGINQETWVRKGFQYFVSLAQLCSFKHENIQFYAIGKIHPSIQDKVNQLDSEIPNLHFTGFVSDEELLEYYQKAKVYCQLSYYESFGVSPAEAMLCECIPVVTKRGALPEVVGETGFIVDYNDANNIYNGVKSALISGNGKQCRQHIVKSFPPEKREKEILKVINKIWK